MAVPETLAAATAGGALSAALEVRARCVTIGGGINWPIEGSSGGAVDGLKPSAASDGETVDATLAGGGTGGCGRTAAATEGAGGASVVSCEATSVAPEPLLWSLGTASGAATGVEGGGVCGATI